MKLPCSVIEDLLPLYHDRVCSTQSSTLVEEHLEECDACKAMLAKIGQEVSHPKIPTDEAKPLKAIQKEWNKGKKRSFFKGSLIAFLVCALLVGGCIGLTQWKIVPVSQDILTITEVSRLTDDSIAFHLFVDDDKSLNFIKFTTTEDGSFYMTPMRSVLEAKRSAEVGLFNRYLSFYISQDDPDTQYQGQGALVPSNVTSVYVGPVGDGVLIWEEGMELPAASEQLEKFLHGAQ